MNLSSFFKNSSSEGRRFVLLFFFSFLVLCPTLLTALLLDISAYNHSSDTFLYFDIAKNLLAGRGFVSSFNVYQFWNGLYYPAGVFLHPVLPLALAFIGIFFSSVKAAVLAQFALCFFNLFLLHRLFALLIRDRRIAFWAVLLVASSVCVQITVLRLLTEQISLTFTLAALLVFFGKPGRSASWVGGLLLGVGMLARAQAAYYPFVFLISSLLTGERRRDALVLTLVSLGVFGLYEIFVYGSFGVFYPEYPQAFKNYFLSTRFFGGAYFAETPVLRPFLESQAGKSFVWLNLKECAYSLFCVLRVLLFFVPWSLHSAMRRKDIFGLTLFLLAFFQIVSVVLFYPYMRVGEFQWVRFLLWPAIAFAVFGFQGMKEFSSRYFRRAGNLFFLSLSVFVLVQSVIQSTLVLEAYWAPKTRWERVEQLKEAIERMKTSVAEGELVAVSESIIGAVSFQRPTVVLPTERTLTAPNLRGFIHIYQPKSIVFEPALMLGEILEELGYKRIPGSKEFSFFEIYILKVLDK